MIRISCSALLLSLAALPAFAHEGAGIVHHLTQADHVAGLIAALALAALFWLVLRGKAPQPQKQKIRKNKD
jgi:hypothetical protein